MSTTPGFRALVAGIADAVALVLALPAAALCWLEVWTNRPSEAVFHFFSHCFALAPGVPGNYLRRAFYRLTLDRCDGRFTIAFGALFTHREAEIQDGVYIGPYALIGSAVLRKRCSIGSRVSLLSGANLHDLGADGRWTPFDPSRLQQIDIGEDVFIGEGAIVMANVGERAFVSAGAVVSSPVPREIVVAGNPARLVRRLEVPAAGPSQSIATRSTETVRFAFVDWMKCLGIFIIVFGHVVASQANFLTAPIYPKQLGVAFFVFATGFTLARERRPVRRVVVGRLFEILLVGLLCAVVISLIRLSLGLGPNGSNYLPLLLGANVVFDNFPANPTTWYIGTYIHIILLWALVLRHVRVTPGLLALALVGEVAVRALLWPVAGEFVAYMLLTNWLTVLLLGMYSGQQAAVDGTWRPSQAWMLLSVMGIGWLVLVPFVGFDLDFPFRIPAMGQPGVPDARTLRIGVELWPALALMSAGVSALYVGITWLAFRATSQLPLPGGVRFIAANTVFIFVVHMPLYFVLLPLMADWSRPWRSAVLLLICFIGLALAGELFRRVVRASELRDQLVRRLEPTLQPEPAATSATR